MTTVLCLGNNLENTDVLVTEIATNNGSTNHGLVTDPLFLPSASGYYHTSLSDVLSSNLLQLAKNFDVVKMLDQPESEWSHWKLLLSTYKVMVLLEQQGVVVEYKQNNNVQGYLAFDKLLAENKSFCIYPWIEKIESNGVLRPCARSKFPITTIEKLESWADDPDYTNLRQRMLKGERIHEVCQNCYNYEDRGIESYRTFETKEWVSKLKINSLEDLDKITHPYLYEIRLSNLCNAACRGCRPEHSSRIETEYKQHKVQFFVNEGRGYSSTSIIDKSTLSPDVRVYLTGGEPTIIPDVYTFMEECIESGKVDFDFTLGTHASTISQRFLDLAKHFTNLQFSVSVDGFEKINDYWRWGTEWNKVISNTKLLQQQGHNISFNCVPGIYNVTNLHLLLEFIDAEFPKAGLYLQLNYFDAFSVFNHPNFELVADSMKRCQQTNVYHTDGKSVRSAVDQIYSFYTTNPSYNVEHLKEFFNYNDRLDEIRHVKLADYIPELEACRSLIQNS